MSDVAQTHTDAVARRDVLLAIPERTPDQEAELDQINIAIAAHAEESPAAGEEERPAADMSIAPGDEHGHMPEAQARQEHLVVLGSRVGARLAAAGTTVLSVERAESISATAMSDVVTANQAAATAVVEADAAKLAGTKDAPAKAEVAKIAVAKAKAMSEAAGLASASVVAAQAYRVAAQAAADAAAAAQVAFGAADVALAAGTPDAAAKMVAAQDAEAKAMAAVEAADHAAEAATNASAMADEALIAAKTPALSALPDEHKNAFGEFRQWVRDEIRLAAEGHSEETRRQMNG